MCYRYVKYGPLCEHSYRLASINISILREEIKHRDANLYPSITARHSGIKQEHHCLWVTQSCVFSNSRVLKPMLDTAGVTKLVVNEAVRAYTVLAGASQSYRI